MKKESKTKILITLVIALALFLIFTDEKKNNSLDNDNINVNLSNYWYLTGDSIKIDDLAPNKNWAYIASNFDWCSGSGLVNDPYIIENLIIEGGGENIGIQINNSRKYCEIKNCIITNFEFGIKMENTTCIKIVNSTISNITALRINNRRKSIGITILNCSDVNLISNNISNIIGENGENGENGHYYGDPGEPGGNGNNAYGIFVNNSNNIGISYNNISKIFGGKGGKGGDGSEGDSSSSGDGGDGGSGGDAGDGGSSKGLYIENCINISNYFNMIYDINGGSGEDGGQGGVGGTSFAPPHYSGDGGNGGNGGNGGSSIGLFAVNSTKINNTLNLFYNIFGGVGEDGGSGGNGGYSIEMWPFYSYGGDGGDGGDGRNGGSSTGLLFLNSTKIVNKLNEIYNIRGGWGRYGGYGGDCGLGFQSGDIGGDGGDGGDGGSSTGLLFLNSTKTLNNLNEIHNINEGFGGYGRSGGYGTHLSGLNGNDGVNGILNGFLLENTNNSLTYFNMIYSQINTDNGQSNQWDNGTIGNYWHYYDGVDIDDDGIGDTPYLLAGSAGSVDNFPIWDDGMEVYLPLFIDGAAKGVGAHNWTWAVTQDWCVGSGTEFDPYIIENIVIESDGSQIGFLIENSRAYFEIRSCTFSKFEIGVKIVNTTDIKIMDVTIKDIKSFHSIQGIDSTGILIDNCSNIIIKSSNISGIVGCNGPFIPQSLNGGDGNDAYGILFNNSINIVVSNNDISNIIGGIGYNGDEGSDGEIGTYPEDGGEGGNGGSCVGLYFEKCTNITNYMNILHDFKGGNGGEGGYGGKGSNAEWDPLGGEPAADGANGGKGGNGGSSTGLFFLNSTKIVNKLNEIYNHICGDGGDGNYGGDGGNGDQDPYGFITLEGGSGGNGGNGGNGGDYSAIIIINCLDIKNNWNNFSDIAGGIGGNGGYPGSTGEYGNVWGSFGINGAIGVVKGFSIVNSNNSLTYNNMIYCELNVDNGTNNLWDNGVIGNYWSYYDGFDLDDDGIGDTPYFLLGTAGSRDNFPLWDDGFTPVASDDAYSVNEDTMLIISAPGVMDNDFDADGDIVNLELNTGPVHGTLTLNPDGSFTYMPDVNYNGADSFTYFVYDSIGAYDMATVSITINPVNDAPLVWNCSYSVNEDSILTVSAPGLLAYSYDVDGDPLTIILVSDVSHGTLTLNSDGTFIYIPDPDYQGTDLFKFKANDGLADSNVGWVGIVVNSMNDPPVAIDDTATTDEDIAVIIDVLANDYDIDGDSLSIVSISNIIGGEVFDNGDGTVTFTPTLDFIGTASFDYTVSDVHDETDTARCTITVLDKTPPESVILVDDTLPLEGWFRSDGLVSFTATDNYAGVSFIEYSYDSGATWEIYTTPFEGAWHGVEIWYRAWDNAGNNENINKYIFQIDKTPPLTTAPLIGDLGENGWYTSDVIVNLTASDIISGVDFTEYSYDNETWETYLTTLIIQSEGITTVYYRSTDNAGWVESAKSIEVKIDKTPPTAIPELIGDLGENNWYTSNVTVSITASDTVSGVDYILYEINVKLPGPGKTPSMPSTVYTEPFTIVMEEQFNIHVWIYDKAGQRYIMNIEVKIDKTPPTTPVQLDGVNINGVWYITDVTVTLEATDATSGVYITEYSYDNETWELYSPSLTIQTEGIITIYYRSTDNAGWVETVNSIEVKIDKTPPLTTAPLIGDLGENGWYTSDVIVNLTASDIISGVDFTEYSYDNEIWETYLTTLIIQSDGITTVYYRSTDNAGWVEAINSIEVKIDKTLPTAIPELIGDLGENNWYTSNVTVSITASDTISGVDYIQYDISIPGSIEEGPPTPLPFYTEPFTIVMEGKFIIVVFVYDKAGQEYITYFQVNIDKTYPTTTATLVGDFSSANGWYRSDVTVTLEATDAYSEVDFTEYSYDNETWVTYLTPLTIQTEGINTLYYRSTDNAGLVEAINSIEVKIDKTPPTATPILIGDLGENGWYISDVTVDLNASDAVSGVDYILIDGSTYTKPFTITMEGQFTIHADIIDKAENLGQITIEVKIDKTPPTTTAKLVGDLGQYNWYRSDVTVTLEATDAYSGVDFTEYSYDNETWEPYLTALSIQTEGITTIYYRSTDNAGWVEAVNSIEVKVDKTPPTADPILIGDLGENGWYTSDVTVDLNASDAVSGVDYILYYVTSDVGFVIDTTVYTGPFTLTMEGQFTIHAYIIDKAENLGQITIEVKIDKTPPTTTAQLDGVNINGVWYITEVSVTLTATDVTSGVSVTEYSYDNVTWNIYTEPLIVQEFGITNIYYRSIDNAGNVEAIKVESFKISIAGIIIDDTGNGDYTWTELSAIGWCSGSGTWNDPYIIEDLTLDCQNFDSCITIRNSAVPFIIRNCEIINSAKGGAPDYYAGIKLINVKYGTIIGSTFTNNEVGIYIKYSDNNQIINNIAENNAYNGIRLEYSDNNEIVGNQANNNQLSGIDFRICHNNLIKENTATNNRGSRGIFVYGNYNSIDSNIVSWNYVGVQVRGSYNTLSNNIISHSSSYGIQILVGNNFQILNNKVSSSENGLYMYELHGTTIISNEFYGQGVGINMHKSNDNQILENYIHDNTHDGIRIHSTSSNNVFTDNILEGNLRGINSASSSNLFYKNEFISNTINAVDEGSNNQWDNGIIGNYWADYPGVDYDDNGIGDTPYVISGTAGSQDNFPIWDDGFTPVASDDSYSVNEDDILIILTPGVMGNDYDADGDLSYVILDVGPLNGTLTLNSDGSFTYEPDLNYNGVDTFTYIVYDTVGAYDYGTVIITVNAVNDAPLAYDASYSTNEDEVLNLPVPGILINVYDVDGDPLNIILVTDVMYGTLTLNPDGSLLYAPGANFYGDDWFEYKVNDGSVDSNIATVTITIVSVNDAPIANDDSATTNEDIAVIIDLLTNDFDVEGDILTIINITGITSGAVLDNGDGTVTYYPALDFVGIAYFDYKISDGQGGINTATCSVTVLDTTPPETTINYIGQRVYHSYTDEFWYYQDVLIELSADDTGVGVSYTEYSFNNVEWYLYTEPFNVPFEGEGTIYYKSTDNSGNLEETLISAINIIYSPFVIDDENTGDYTWLEASLEPWCTGSGTEIDPYIIENLVIRGDVFLESCLEIRNSDVYFILRNCSFFNGKAGVLLYNVNKSVLENNYLKRNQDGIKIENSFWNNITENCIVESKNVGIYLLSSNNNTVSNCTLFDNINGITLNNSHSNIICYNHLENNIIGIYMENSHYNDIHDNKIISRLKRRETAIEDKGCYNYISSNTIQGYEFGIELFDSYGTEITINTFIENNVAIILSGSVENKIEGNTFLNNDDYAVVLTDNSIENSIFKNQFIENNEGYVQAYDDSGSNHWTDENGIGNYWSDYEERYPDTGEEENTWDTAYVIDGPVEIVDDGCLVNPAPVTVDDIYSVLEDNVLTVAAPGVMENDYDSEGDLSYVTLDIGPLHGTITLNSDGSFTYVPEDDYNGDDTFTYIVYDTAGAYDYGTVLITVIAVNDVPLAYDASYSTNEDEVLNLPVPGILINVYDVDGDILNTILVTDVMYGTLTLDPDGSLLYIPDANFFGNVWFEYKVNDGSVDSNTAIVTINVVSVNDAPIADDDTITTDEDIPGDISLSASDIEGDSLTYIIVDHPLHGTLSIIGSNIIYTPEPDYYGIDFFTFKVNDGSLDSNIATIKITINSINDDPVAISDTATTDEGTAVNIYVLANDFDVDGDPLSIIEVTSPNWGTAVISGNIIVYTPYMDYSGEVFFTYTISDSKGGFDTAAVIVTVLDKTAPTTLLAIQGPHNGADPTYVTTATTFKLNATDNPLGSGVDRIEYQIDSNGWNTYNIPFNLMYNGSYIIYYRSIDNAGNKEIKQSLWVVVNAVKLTYTGEVHGNYSDPVFLEAKLIDMATLLPIPGKTIEFTIGSQTVSAVTDLNGVASVMLILDQPGGLYTVSASFAGDEIYLPDSDSALFIIQKETAYLAYTGSTVVPTTVETFMLRVTVYDDVDGYWGNLTKINVTFKIYSAPIDPNFPPIVYGSYRVENTTVDGVGKFSINVPNLPENAYLVQVNFTRGENHYYQGIASDLVPLIIYEPTGDFVTGGGWIWDTTGSKGNFGFNVKYKKNGLPKGQAIYVYREGDWEFIVKSNAWEGMAVIDNRSVFEAKCVVQQYNSKTGEFLWSEGNYRMRIEVWDEDKEGGDDVFQIRVFDKFGQVYHEAGYEPYGILQGGNIVIHTDEEE